MSPTPVPIRSSPEVLVMGHTAAEQLIHDADDAFADYRRAVAPFFAYLRARARHGFSPAQFRTYRDNYFYRTDTTAVVIAHLAAQAADRRDRDTLSALAKNLNEESGEGVPARSHPLLLEESYNTFAARVFGLPPVTLAGVADSPVLLPEARAYRTRQLELVKGADYLTALGASFTQETMATGMLQEFYDSLFLPYRHRLPGGFSLIALYFTVHLNGVEEEHGKHARESVCRNCLTDADRRTALLGVHGFLSAQQELWGALHRALVAGEGAGPAIPTDAA